MEEFKEPEIWDEKEKINQQKEELISLLKLKDEEISDFERIISFREKENKEEYQRSLLGLIKTTLKNKGMLGTEKEMFDFMRENFGVLEDTRLTPEEWKKYPLGETIFDLQEKKPKILLNIYFHTFPQNKQLTKLVELISCYRYFEEEKEKFQHEKEGKIAPTAEMKIKAIKNVLSMEDILALNEEDIKELNSRLGEAEKKKQFFKNGR